MSENQNKQEEYTDDAISLTLEKAKDIQDFVDYRMKLASKIYHSMKAKGWNQTQFAEVMGKRGSVISRWLSGTHNFESDTLFQISKKLSISLLDLSDYKPSVKQKTFQATADSRTVVNILVVKPGCTDSFLEGHSIDRIAQSKGGQTINSEDLIENTQHG